MNALLLFTAMMGQCPLVIYEPYCPPIYPSVSRVYEKVYLDEPIQTRIIVEAIHWPTRKRITVPVINGYSPAVRITNLPDGNTLREYDYDDGVVWQGGVIEYGKKSNSAPKYSPPKAPSPKPKAVPAPSREPVPQKQMPRFTDDDFDDMQKDIRSLEETIRVLKQRDQAYEREKATEDRSPVTLQAEPIRVEPKKKMKKPSEFGREE